MPSGIIPARLHPPLEQGPGGEKKPQSSKTRNRRDLPGGGCSWDEEEAHIFPS